MLHHVRHWTVLLLHTLVMLNTLSLLFMFVVWARDLEKRRKNTSVLMQYTGFHWLMFFFFFFKIHYQIYHLRSRRIAAVYSLLVDVLSARVARWQRSLCACFGDVLTSWRQLSRRCASSSVWQTHKEAPSVSADGFLFSAFSSHFHSVNPTPEMGQQCLWIPPADTLI